MEDHKGTIEKKNTKSHLNKTKVRGVANTPANREKRLNYLKDLAIEYSIRALSSNKFKKAEKLTVALKVIPAIMPKQEIDVNVGFSLSKLFDQSRGIIDATPQKEIEAAQTLELETNKEKENAGTQIK